MAESLARRQPFEAVAVVGTATCERIAVAIVRDAHVPELGMQEAVRHLTADDHAAADPGSDRDVAERVESLRGAEAPFAERCCADVGLDRDRHTELRGEQRADVGAGPAGLGRRRDRTEARGAFVEIERPERADSDRDDLRMRCEELQRRGRSSRPGSSSGWSRSPASRQARCRRRRPTSSRRPRSRRRSREHERRCRARDPPPRRRTYHGTHGRSSIAGKGDNAGALPRRVSRGRLTKGFGGVTSSVGWDLPIGASSSVTRSPGCSGVEE